jgi:hypothetical protein
MPMSLGEHTRTTRTTRTGSMPAAGSASATRRTLFGSALAGAVGAAAMLAGATPAFADETWCDVDPPVLIRTPGGNNVVVFVVDAAADQYRDWLKRPQIAYAVIRTMGSTSPTGAADPTGRRTQVDLEVVIPLADGLPFPVRSGVWSSPGQHGVLFSERVGVAGETLRHTFWLDVE